jgi:hypothetical protein
MLQMITAAGRKKHHAAQKKQRHVLKVKSVKTCARMVSATFAERMIAKTILAALQLQDAARRSNSIGFPGRQK